MPHLLDVPGTVRWIRRDGLDTVLAGLVRYLESDLLRWGGSSRRSRVWPATPRTA